MDVKWLWLGVVLVLLVVAVVLAACCWPTRTRPRPDAVLMAHAARLRRVPRYRALLRQQLVSTGLRCVAVLVLLLGTILLSVRPFSEAAQRDPVTNRDIMLCLDVSGSMTQYDEQIVREFARIAEGLEGERIGLTIFNEVAVTVFPLTDDYDFVVRQLDEAADAFADHDFDFTAGVLLSGGAASLIGDGLVSCVDRFDRPDDQRGRAVVLASDNAPQGKGVFTLPEAADYAASEDVIVYGLGAPGMTLEPKAVRGFADATEATGGRFELMEDGSIGAIVDGIHRLEAERMEKPPEVVVDDEPRWGAGLASLGVVLVVLAGLRRRA